MTTRVRIAVVGAGTMGSGIAELCASRGLQVQLFDVDRAQSEAAVARTGERAQRRVSEGKLSAQACADQTRRLTVATSLAEAVREADVVIESVPEDAALKARVLAQALEHAASAALIGSNTSSLSISELATRSGAGPRLIGMHFFNPPPVMPLIELVRGAQTTDAQVERALELVALLGKEPIVVKDAPGFATSRLGVALGAEAMRMLQSGVASVRDIDRAMELGYKHPMGPLKLTDLVGLDVRLSILEHLAQTLGPQFEPPSLLRAMVRAGLLGKKTGKGFYVWTQGEPVPNLELPSP